MPDIIKSTGVKIPFTAEMWADAEAWRAALERSYEKLEERLREA